MRKFIFAVLVVFCLATPSWAATHTDFAHAIAYAEGFYVKGSKASRNHNPGNIRRGGRYVRFKNDTEGWQALEGLLYRMSDGRSRVYDVNMTLAKFGKIYADGSKYWAKNVARFLGVAPTDYLWEIIDSHPRVVVPIKLKQAA